MKASELIEKLTHCIVLYGDKEILVFDRCACSEGYSNIYNEIEDAEYFLDDDKIHIW